MDDRLMTKEESYVERRQLFKNIWDTAMQIDEREDVLNKPKVIKTLRLSEVDKCPVGKTKKQRIKNLRHVCKKILDFCDKQDAEDKFYEQVAAAGQPDFMSMTVDTEQAKHAVVKHRAKKMTKAKSMITRKVTAGFVTNSEAKDLFNPFSKTKTSRPTSPLRVNKLHKPIKRKKHLNPKPALRKSPQQLKVAKSSKREAVPGEPAAAPRRGRKQGSKKKRGKKKMKSDTEAGPTTTGTTTSPRRLCSGM